ncbi:hypothetical protein B4098_2668 [Heyndrickxia coagulans]|jgi:hypothetical protein|uniref:Uncharacterized protein n=1 Tax=Heyndrickxia coagulans TaxID=1398 RepID=A0A150KJD3_HEYCO|nr:hypothetical protein B4098_2668 [Heyndrickxia coagulans]KYC73836.1 hypothetical protein B4099_2797 [Heyndrickxia coagulans]
MAGFVSDFRERLSRRPAKPLHDRGAKLKSKEREKIGLPGSFLKGSFAEVEMASMPFLLVLY